MVNFINAAGGDPLCTLHRAEGQLNGVKFDQLSNHSVMQFITNSFQKVWFGIVINSLVYNSI